MKFFYIYHSSLPTMIGRNSIHTFSYDNERSARLLLRDISSKTGRVNKYTFLQIKRRV